MHWMFNCREVSGKVSRSMDAPLSVGERVAVRMHLLMCAICRRYKNQLLMMRRMFRGLSADDPSGEPLFRLDASAKWRLRQTIDSHLASEK